MKKWGSVAALSLGGLALATGKVVVDTAGNVVGDARRFIQGTGRVASNVAGGIYDYHKHRHTIKAIEDSRGVSSITGEPVVGVDTSGNTIKSSSASDIEKMPSINGENTEVNKKIDSAYDTIKNNMSSINSDNGNVSAGHSTRGNHNYGVFGDAGVSVGEKMDSIRSQIDNNINSIRQVGM
jgi:hypothetical protein